MGRIERLYEKAKNSPQNLTFEEACTLAEAAGYQLRRPERKKSGSSHHIYKHPNIEDHLNLQPVGKKAKAYQVKQLVGYIEQYGLLEE